MRKTFDNTGDRRVGFIDSIDFEYLLDGVRGSRAHLTTYADRCNGGSIPQSKWFVVIPLPLRTALHLGKANISAAAPSFPRTCFLRATTTIFTITTLVAWKMKNNTTVLLRYVLVTVIIVVAKAERRKETCVVGLRKLTLIHVTLLVFLILRFAPGR